MSLIGELQRRNVIRISIAYLAASWLLIQIADTLLPIYGFGDATIRIVVAILLIGFIPAVIFSWVFELTPEGLRRDSAVDHSLPIAPTSGKKLDRAIIVVLGLALVYFAIDKLVLSESRIETAREVGRKEALLKSYGDQSIAVLPFVDMSAAADQEYMSDGIAEELLNLLAKVPELRVISRSSAFSFKGKDLSIPEIAEQLNVAHILEGSVRKSGNRIRITAQLIEARTDTHLWSETYDRDLIDIFAIQDEVSAQVVNELKIVMLVDAPKSIVTDPQAYELFLQARFLSDQVTVDTVQRAIELYQRVLDIDPEYVPAWVWMAHAHHSMFLLGVPDANEHMRLQEESINRALAIDPNNAIALATASAMSTANWDIELAVSQIKRALEIAPNNLEVIRSSAFIFEKLSRNSDYLKVTEYVLARDPLNGVVRVDTSFANLSVGNYQRVIELSEQSLSMWPDSIIDLIFLTSAVYRAGDPEAALELSKQIPLAWYRIIITTMTYHVRGDQSAYESGIREMLQMLEDGEPASNHYDMASVFSVVGDWDAAFSELEKSVELSEHIIRFDDILFSAMHDDPRYDVLMERAGMPREKMEAIQFEAPIPAQ